jgi:hypothetical protein
MRRLFAFFLSAFIGVHRRLIFSSRFPPVTIDLNFISLIPSIL